MRYLLSEMFIVLAYIMFGATFLTKNKKRMLIYTLLNTYFFFSHYFCVGGYAGMIADGVGIIRTIWFYIDESHGKKKNYMSLSVCIALLIVCSMFTFSSWREIFATLAALIAIIAIWQPSILIYRYSMLGAEACWIAYHVVHFSLFGIIGEGVMVVIDIYSIFNYYHKNKYKIDKKIIKLGKKVYKGDKSGHGFDHIKRVLKYCEQIHRVEGGDWFILSTAAIFHDVHRVMQNEVGHYVTPSESIPRVKELLSQLNISQENIEKIVYIIEHHEKKSQNFDNLELKILIDADILDAVGREGLRRTLTYCKTHGVPLSSDVELDSKDYVPDVHPISAKHYVYRTQIPAINNLKTDTAKKIVNKNLKALNNFIYK